MTFRLPRDVDWREHANARLQVSATLDECTRDSALAQQDYHGFHLQPAETPDRIPICRCWIRDIEFRDTDGSSPL